MLHVQIKNLNEKKNSEKSSIDQTETKHTLSSSLPQQRQDQITKNNLFKLSVINQISNKILTTNFNGYFLWQLQKL